MARPYWSGQVQISLVSFGVKLFTATEAKNEIRFHQIERSTGERVRHQKVRASAVEADPGETTETVQQSDIVKGYEYAKGQYVTIEPDELAALRVPSKHTMEILQFVEEKDVDPEFYEKPYFVVPENENSTEAFLTVREAMIDTGRIGLTKIAFNGREHVVALAPAGDEKHPGMMAYTMRYAAELRNADEYFRDIPAKKVDDDSLGLAKELIKRKAGPFDPSRYVDGYEVAVKELVDAKVNHLPIPRDEAPAPRRNNVVNLMDALRKSVSSDTGETAAEAPTAKPPKSAKSAHAKASAAEEAAGPVLVKKTAKPSAKSSAAKSHSRRKSA